jgi:DNA polymerase-3 subunit epsilon
MNQLFSVVDIETTGGGGKYEKITEIAIFVTDGYNLVRSFHSLINPERRIPPYIVNLTRITNEMVEDSPKFYEVAKQILETLSDTVFVAHNVIFDYGILKKEFAELGYKFRMNTLCTLQLSRKLFPGLSSYSLGELCKSLGIEIFNRHRAAGDAKATMHLFNMIYRKDLAENNGLNVLGFQFSGLSPKIKISKFQNLPDTVGVYYLYNENDEVIYIGKSKNIKQRVFSHLKNECSKKSLNMRSEIADVDYVETGFELIALIHESNEIKKHKPKYNVAQRRSIYNWGIYFYENSEGYFCFTIKKITDTDEMFLAMFSSHNEAIETMRNFCEKYQLCTKFCGLYESSGACFYHSIGECKGACCGEESPDDYNIKAQKFMEELNIGYDNVYIMHENKAENLIAFVKIQNSHFKGYGYFDNLEKITDIDDFLTPMPETRDIKQIIKTYLKKNSDYKIVKLKPALNSESF